MPSSYSPNLRIELIANGEQSGTWGTTTNTNLGTLIEDAISGYVSVPITLADQALTVSNGVADQSRNMVVNLTTTTGADFNVYIPPAEKVYIIRNASSFNATIYCGTSINPPGNTTAAGAGVTIPAGRETLVFSDATNVIPAVDYLATLSLGTALPLTSGGTGSATASGARTNLGLGTIATQNANAVTITGGSITGITDLAVADGGTGASDASGARTNLGATTVGANFFTLTSPGAITFIRVNADNTVSTLDAATFRTAIGAGVGSVTSVTGTGTASGLTLSGTVTSSGNITLSGTVNALAAGTYAIDISGNATTATTANALNTSNNYRVNSIGVGAAATGTAGEIVATDNITAYYSDERLKTKLGRIENALDKLCSLEGFYYEANETAQALGYEAKREVGVSAQQMQNILPEIVAPAPIDNTYLTVRYERALPLIVEAIKELRAEVKALKKGA
jgi:hypothetical protein